MEYPVKDIKIERLATFNTRKDGSPLVTKAGKPYKKVLIDVNSDCIDDFSFTGKLSMLDFDGVADNWKEGDTITGNIIHDGDYWNFELPKVNLRDEITRLEKENAELRLRLDRLGNEPITDDDLPF